jgi:ubiquitin carboxyl-terminal hydrolase 9/24
VKHDVVAALSERLDILRFVYGISDHVKLSLAQLQHLWQLCTIPSDREALMMFIADASGSDPGPAPQGPALAEPQPVHAQLNKVQQAVVVEPVVAAAFSDSVRTSAFLDLFCSMTVNWGELGEGAYRSFQSMFKKLRLSPEASIVTTAQSLDALWRICLNAGNDAVASEAMKDLLSVYTTMAGSSSSQNAWGDDRMSPTGSDSMTIDSGEDSFGNRVFQCLVEVKKGLEAGTASSERSAERCLRILNAAVSHDGSSGRSVSSSGLEALSTVSNVASLPKAMARLPHGMRGQSCYRRIQMHAKRSPMIPVGNTLPTQGVERKENISTAGSKVVEHRFTLYVHPLETIASIKEKIAEHCDCQISAIKTISINGRRAPMANRSQGNDPQPMNLNLAAEDLVVDQLRIEHGCHVTVLFGDQPMIVQGKSGNTKRAVEAVSALNVSEIFQSGGEFADRLFETLLGVLELLPWRETEENGLQAIDSHKLVWDLLLAIPTNSGIIQRVQAASRLNGVSNVGDKDAMVLDTPLEQWPDLLDRSSFHHSVYVMQVIESFLQPAPEALTTLPPETRTECIRALVEDAKSFREAFILSGGFDAVVRWFSMPANDRSQKQSERRMGNAVALRILKCCLFGSSQPVVSADAVTATVLDEAGKQLLRSLTNVRGLLTSLASMVVLDDGIASATILDVLRFLWLLFGDAKNTEIFVSLPNGLAEKFLVTLLLWEGGPDSMRTNTIALGNADKIRRDAHDLILKIPSLATHALPWLTGALGDIDVTSDATSEYFDVLRHLVERQDEYGKKASGKDLQELGTAVCQKLLSCPRPTNDSALIDFSTGVLCGCLSLLRAIIETGGSNSIKAGTNILLDDLKIIRWSEQTGPPSSGVLQRVSSPFRSRPRPDDAILIDLMGAIFDGFLSPGGSSSVVAICCDEKSRSLGFDAVATAARSCQGHDGYVSLIHRINGIVKAAEPHLRHRWNQNGNGGDSHARSHKNTATYSGLRNQGCTCYMNSFLQQMFMMPELRERMCSAPIPASLRTSGGSFAKGAELVGKKISLQWDSGISYDAVVEGYDAATKMHTIRYCPMPVATVGGGGHQQVHPDEISLLPSELSEEFFLSEGRPGKETGVFEIVEASSPSAAGEGTSENGILEKRGEPVQETEDESSSRHLLEEVQRTFIHLDEGSRGRCFDPRALVEACACLKLEFDVWQQNDASEFAMKLLDRMEIALKKWAPEQFRYLDHTFGLKQTKQKVCKECGLKVSL